MIRPRKKGVEVQKIGVVGAGTIGADLAYAFAAKVAKGGGKVVLCDNRAEALEAAMGRLKGYAAKAVARGKMTAKAAEGLMAAIETTGDFAKFRECDVVVEAATENIDVKIGILQELENVVGPQCLMFSTTSSIPRGRLAGFISHPERFGVFHPFTPAWRSLVVELVGDREGGHWQRMHDFAVTMGKVPIITKDTPCFAFNDIFIAYCLEAAWLVEDGVGTVAQVNAVADRIVGGGGAFFVLNLTRANQIGVFCAEMMRERHGNWWMPPELLVAKGAEPWDLSGDPACDAETEQAIAERLEAVILGRALWIVDNGVCKASDLDWGCRMGLGFKWGPVARYNEQPEQSYALVRAYKADHPEFVVPTTVTNMKSVSFFRDLTVQVDDGIAVVTIRRPEVMNALSAHTIRELQTCLMGLEDDPGVDSIILTGFGGAVAGADIPEIAAVLRSNDPAKTAKEFAGPGQDLMCYIDTMHTPVLFVANGPVLGGGCELALACHGRVVGPSAMIGQPEVNLGIIPGYGGTQRLPRLIGMKKALGMMRTGTLMDAKAAMESGWAQASGDDPLAGAKHILLLPKAERPDWIRPIHPCPMEVPDNLSLDMDIGHHSKVIDMILVEVVVEGCQRQLDVGLRMEAEAFGNCCLTKDMAIGLANFQDNGPRVPAVFVNA